MTNSSGDFLIWHFARFAAIGDTAPLHTQIACNLALNLLLIDGEHTYVLCGHMRPKHRSRVQKGTRERVKDVEQTIFILFLVFRCG